MGAQERSWPLLAAVPALLIVVAGVVLPLACLFALSLHGTPGSAPPPAALAASAVVEALTAVLMVPLELAAGTLLALALPRRGPLFTVLLVLLLIPPMLPPTVVAVLARGLASGLPQLFPWAALLLVDLWHWAPLIAAPALVALRTVPPRAWAAARFDGLGRWAMFRHLLLPRLAPVLWVGAGLRLVGIIGLTAEPLGLAVQGRAATPTTGTLLLDAGGATGFTAFLACLLGLVVLLLAGILVARAAPFRDSGA